MKIAMIGHKDFPSRSGGVEVVVYEPSTRLAEKGLHYLIEAFKNVKRVKNWLLPAKFRIRIMEIK